MKGIISSSKTELEIINKKINDYMILNVRNYNATQWGEIVKHRFKEEWILFINEDERNPRMALTNDNKLKHVEFDINDYYDQSVV